VMSGAYSPLLSLRWFNEGWRVAWGATLGTGLLAGTLYLSYRDLSRLQFLYFYAVRLALLLAYRAAPRLYYRVLGKGRPGGGSRLLIVGAGDLGGRLASTLLDHSRWGFKLAGFLDDDPKKSGSRPFGLPTFGTLEAVQEVVVRERIDEVWAALPLRAQQRLTELVNSLERQPVRIKVVPDTSPCPWCGLIPRSWAGYRSSGSAD